MALTSLILVTVTPTQIHSTETSTERLRRTRKRLPQDKDGETHRETVRQTGEDSHKTKMERHADRETDRQ